MNLLCADSTSVRTYLGVGHDVVKHGHVGFLSDNLTLDIDGDEFCGETSQVATGNSFH